MPELSAASTKIWVELIVVLTACAPVPRAIDPGIPNVPRNGSPATTTTLATCALSTIEAVFVVFCPTLSTTAPLPVKVPVPFAVL